ncbi:MAG: hypothetical protein HQL02_10615 [Nitrospirae bacterium]|nr:hypothetical protein [Nitrospirota bacterium]
MSSNTDKLFCNRHGCFKYVVVCVKCKHASSCDLYMRYRQPRLFDIQPAGKASLR